MKKPKASPETVAYYFKAATVATLSDIREERVVGMVLTERLKQEPEKNQTLVVKECLARFDAAIKRIREEMKAIHS